MFSILKRTPTIGKEIVLKISGMHCTSCALNIDGELEDIDGVIRSSTNYAKQETTVVVDVKKVKAQKLIETIKAIGYEAVVYTI